MSANEESIATARESRRIPLPSPGMLAVATLILIFGNVMTWYGVRCLRQQTVRDHVEEHFGRVQSVVTGPVWLHDLITRVGSRNAARGLEEINTISLHGSHIVDDDFEVLHGLPHLRCLNIVSTEITDAALGRMAESRSLEVVNLSDNPVTDEGIKRLSELPELQILVLNHTDVTGSGFEHGFERLEELNLAHTSISDAELPHLARLPSLRRLTLTGTGISDQAIADLRAQLPDCAIWRHAQR